MKGDFSRQTFDPSKHYSDVLMQQGRVQLDADWNEQQAIHRYRAERGAQDIIGYSGAPAHNPGFEIVLSQDRSTFLIGAGNYYVAGILCENEATVPYGGQPDLLDAPAVREILQRAGTTFGIVYLDVWRRHVTALDDRSMRESALGGPDTTTRVKTIWQVKVLPVKEPQGGFVGCTSFFEEWEKLLAGGKGALDARSRPASSVPNPCILPASAGFRGLENQLYRVEIHRGGVLGDPNNVPTFKWSRDNGTVVTAIEKISGQEVTVRDLGPDELLGFASGQWVELCDDAAELAGAPGQLLQIDNVNRSTRVIKLTSAPSPLASGPAGVEPKRHPKLRRWDSVKDLPAQVPSSNEGFIPLENGVEVKFEPGIYATGDYWLIPARTAINGETGTIEWPFASSQPPFGIRHQYCRIALLRRNQTDNTLTVQDCRKIFPPLTGVGALHVVGTNWLNDDVMPLAQLQQDGLQVTLDGVPSQPTPETPGAPQSVNPGSFIVTLEAPLAPSPDPNAVLPRVNMILNGKITVEKNSIQWKPELAELLKLVEGPPSLRLIRVTLKGSAIWSIQGEEVFYLDGQAFGRPGLRPGSDAAARTDLLFPSGAGVRASDFESWLFVPAQIRPPLPDLDSFNVTPGVVRAGQPVTVVLALNRPSPSGGTAVALAKTVLSGSDPVPTLPQAVTVPEGQTTVSLSTATRADAAGSVSVKATLRGAEKTASLTTRIVSVTITPPAVSLFAGATVQFNANVEGAEDNTVTFTIREGVRGGSIARTAPTRATYTAPREPGQFQVVATSAADPTKSAIARVTVTEKRKDSKEGKDIKEKEVEKVRDKLKDITDTKIRDVHPLSGGGPRPEDLRATTRAQADRGLLAAQDDRGEGQAFIRPDERPPVGEPRGSAKEPTRKRAKRRKKER